MADGAGFEAYLSAKRIDSAAFRMAEPGLWSAWKEEFEQLHPNSFTLQKLNLINAIRRKYLRPDTIEANSGAPKAQAPPSGPARPVMRPKPAQG